MKKCEAPHNNLWSAEVFIMLLFRGNDTNRESLTTSMFETCDIMIHQSKRFLYLIWSAGWK